MSSRIEFLLRHRSDHAYTAMPIGPLPAFLGVDPDGRAALLVPAKNFGRLHSVETDYLTLSLFTPVNVTGLSQVAGQETFHLLVCKQAAKGLRDPFEALAVGLAEVLTTSDDADEKLIYAFASLCDLFRTKPAREVQRQRVGLWGELFLMREVGGHELLSQFWHTEPTRKFDFSCGSLRLEVKCTTGEDRVHVFSHQQLQEQDRTEVLVASLVLRYEDSGLTLAELINEAREALAHDFSSRTKLERAVRVANMWDTDGTGPAFDEDHARQQLRFYHASKLPRFPMAEPEGVSGTTYRVTLSGAVPMPCGEVPQWLARWRR